MAFIGNNIDEVFKKQIKNKLNIEETDFNSISEMFSAILSLIERNYLSHLKTAIEDTVNARMKAEVMEQIKKTAISSEAKAVFTKAIKLNQFRPFSILLIPIVDDRKKTSTRMINRSAVISYDPRIETKQLRIYLAHEFGHIVIREFYPDSNSRHEHHASLFAFFALLDKDNFYKSEAKKLTHVSDLELLDSVVALIR